MEERRNSSTTTESVIPPVQDSNITIDSALLSDVVRRRLRSWLVLGPVIFAAVAGYQLLRMPQSYTASVSVAVQQSSGGTSPLALLTGNSNTKKYIGILHSRLLAEAVESKIHLQQFYHLPSERRAVDLLMDSAKPEDNPNEGLLFLRVTLTGPARFAPDPLNHREQAKRLVADVANEYIAQLRQYYATSDNDRDSVLLSAAAKELQRARANYDRAVVNIRAFVADLRNTDSLTAPTSITEGPASSPGSLQSLYDQIIRIEAQLRGAEAAQQSETSSVQRQLNRLAVLPNDDPFLAIARQNLNDARVNLKTLINAYQLSDDNPKVVTAREKVRIAEAELQNQEQGYREGLTTERLAADTKLKSLRAQRDSIQASIREAESRLPTRRERTTAMIELQREQEISLAALKVTEEKAAELRMTSVSANSRLSVVDSAIPAETGQPGLLRASMIAFLLAAVLFFPIVLWDYQRQARQRTSLANPLAAVPHTNGAKPEEPDRQILNGTPPP